MKRRRSTLNTDQSITRDDQHAGKNLKLFNSATLVVKRYQKLTVAKPQRSLDFILDLEKSFRPKMYGKVFEREKHPPITFIRTQSTTFEKLQVHSSNRFNITALRATNAILESRGYLKGLAARLKLSSMMMHCRRHLTLKSGQQAPTVWTTYNRLRRWLFDPNLPKPRSCDYNTETLLAHTTLFAPYVMRTGGDEAAGCSGHVAACLFAIGFDLSIY